MTPLNDAATSTALATIYGLFIRSRTWPTFKAVDRELDRVGIDAESTLSPLAPAWVLFATNSPDSSDVKLTFAGAAQVADAGTLVDAAARVAGWIADSERESNQVAIPGHVARVTAFEAQLALGLDTNTACCAFELLAADGFPYDTYSHPHVGGVPEMTLGRRVRSYRSVRTVDDYMAVRHPGRDPDPARPQVADGSFEGMRVFVSHAFADKAEFVTPLALALRKREVEVWYDDFELVAGDSLAEEIDRGLADCQHAIVVLSPAYMAGRYAIDEFDAILHRRSADRSSRVIPVWHHVDAPGVMAFSPTLARLKALKSEDGPERVAEEIVRALVKSRGRRNAQVSRPGLTDPQLGRARRLP